MECFRLLLEHLAWIEHQFLSGIKDSRKAGSLWGRNNALTVMSCVLLDNSEWIFGTYNLNVLYLTRITTITTKETIIWRLQVQSCLLASNNTGILSTCTRLWLTESEQMTPVDSIKDVVRSSVKVPEFDKHLKKAGGHIGRNFVEITIKMKTIVQKPLMIKIIKLRNLDN